MGTICKHSWKPPWGHPRGPHIGTWVHPGEMAWGTRKEPTCGQHREPIMGATPGDRLGSPMWNQLENPSGTIPGAHGESPRVLPQEPSWHPLVTPGAQTAHSVETPGNLPENPHGEPPDHPTGDTADEPTGKTSWVNLTISLRTPFGTLWEPHWARHWGATQEETPRELAPGTLRGPGQRT